MPAPRVANGSRSLSRPVGASRICRATCTASGGTRAALRDRRRIRAERLHV